MSDKPRGAQPVAHNARPAPQHPPKGRSGVLPRPRWDPVAAEMIINVQAALWRFSEEVKYYSCQDDPIDNDA